MGTAPFSCRLPHRVGCASVSLARNVPNGSTAPDSTTRLLRDSGFVCHRRRSAILANFSRSLRPLAIVHRSSSECTVREGTGANSINRRVSVRGLIRSASQDHRRVGEAINPHPSTHVEERTASIRIMAAAASTPVHTRDGAVGVCFVAPTLIPSTDRVAPGRCQPGAPTDPYLLALEHTVPQIRDSLRVDKAIEPYAPEPVGNDRRCH